MNCEEQISLQKRDNSGEHKNLSETERVFRNREAQKRYEYLIRTRNDIASIVRFR